jgi:predicted MFS family arabinose efflux permease
MQDSLYLRAALSAIFFVNGLVLANWYPRIPTAKAALQLSETQLGLALLGVAFGSVLSMPIAGVVTHRLGYRPVVRFMIVCYSAALPLLGLAVNWWSLGLALLLIGAAVGALDVAMNAGGMALERRERRTALPALHGIYSIGVLAGTLAGAAAAAVRMNLVAHFATVAGIALVVSVMAGCHLPDEGQPRHRVPAVTDDPEPSGLPKQLVLLSVVAFCALFAEGGVINWASVYVAYELGASPGLAAGGLIGFSLTMTAARLAGGLLIMRLGAVRLIRIGSSVATSGLAIGLIVGNVSIAILAFTLVGAGIASIFPLVLSACSRQPAVSPATAIAVVSTIGYLGHLAAPPAIGMIADQTSLTVGIALIAVVTTIIALLASQLATNASGYGEK